MQTRPDDAHPNNAFLRTRPSAARIGTKLTSLQDFLRMRAGYVDGRAELLSPQEMLHIVDEIDSLHPMVNAVEARQASLDLRELQAG